MAVFTYTALSSDGRTTVGTIPADSRAAAIAAVISKGMAPVSIDEQIAGEKAKPVPRATGGRVTQAHLESFTHERATLLAGGVPLARALFLLRRETSAPGPKLLWEQIHNDVVCGTSLADAMA